MQNLKIFQSMWAMEQRIPARAERSFERRFQMISDASYDGVCLDPAVDEIDDLRELKTYFERFNLGCMINAFPRTAHDMEPLYAFANELNASLVNIIGGVMPIEPTDAVSVVRRWISEAEEAGVPLLFETHRDSLLNDLYYTLQVIDLVPEIRLCADLSHIVVDREMRDPITAVDQAYIDRIIEKSDCFQGRVANREQIQIQIDFPQHQRWVNIFRCWWKQGIHAWRRRNDDDAILIFLCELGPPPYAITDANQRELSDRWLEALKIREWIRDIWDEFDEEDSM